DAGEFAVFAKRQAVTREHLAPGAHQTIAAQMRIALVEPSPRQTRDQGWLVRGQCWAIEPLGRLIEFLAEQSIDLLVMMHARFAAQDEDDALRLEIDIEAGFPQ